MSKPSLEILGRYKILRVIGRGAMGVVYEAIDPDIDRVVAIKTINLTLSPEEMVKYEARFKQEIKAAGRLNHPNIVTIYDVGKKDNFAYMAMEFINGCELKDLLKSGTALPVDVALDIIAQAAEGLAFAHSREIIHRDVKPANIMLLENEEGVVAKITDFGIARMPASALKTMTGMVMGSPRYMSPEQVIGGKVSARSDVFALGVVLYEALTGKAPFEAESISSIMYQTVHAVERPASNLNPLLDPELDAIIAMALAKSPEDRFETMKAFSRKLRDVIRSRGGTNTYTLVQLRANAGMPPASTGATAPDAPVVTAPVPNVPDLNGTRMTKVRVTTAPKAVSSTEEVAPEPLMSAALPGPVPTASVEPDPLYLRTVVMSAPAVAPPEQVDSLELTGWPVAAASEFDSTTATLRLAELTSQTDEIKEFISASRQLPVQSDTGEWNAEQHAKDMQMTVMFKAPAAMTANEGAAITLTMDPAPAPREIPLPPLLLLAGLASTVLILLVSVLATF
jgi:serine/threonine-protein kinase